MTSEIYASVDCYAAPHTLMGWATKREAGRLVTDLRIEVWRGEEIIASTTPTAPRPDVTGDDVTLAGFTLICPSDVATEQILSGQVVIRAADAAGQAVPVPIWERTRAEMRRQMLLEAAGTADIGLAIEMLEALSSHPGLAAAAAQVGAVGRTLTAFAATGAAAARTRPKITLIGAGSTVFAKSIIGDLLLQPALSAARIVLYDIDPERLRVSGIIGGRIHESLGGEASIETTLDLGQALDGADYAITMIQVGGYQPGTVTDFEIPKRFGLRQTIGDTVGMGGIMRGLRTIPALLEIVREMERRCPDVIHLNYSNPMAMNVWALRRASAIRTIGLCHSVPRTLAEMASDAGVPVEGVRFLAAGINHMAFFLKFGTETEDLYPRLHALSRSDKVPPLNQIRYDVLRRMGYFVTESSEHFAEYVPWYIRRGQTDLIQRLNIPLDDYPRRCREQLQDWERLSKSLLDPALSLDVTQTNEYASTIVNAMVTGGPAVVYANVPNTDIITNLPSACCVEVPCLVDHTGIHPLRIGDLPLQLASLIQTNVGVQALTVEAALSGRRDHVYQAAMLDPHTAAELNLDQIWDLVDMLLAAHRPLLPQNHFDEG